VLPFKSMQLSHFSSAWSSRFRDQLYVRSLMCQLAVPLHLVLAAVCWFPGDLGRGCGHLVTVAQPTGWLLLLLQLDQSSDEIAWIHSTPH
jgi:hypothetical protein